MLVNIFINDTFSAFMLFKASNSLTAEARDFRWKLLLHIHLSVIIIKEQKKI